MLVKRALGGIGSEFGLEPALLRSPQPSARMPVRAGRCIWLNSGRAAILWALQALRQFDPTRSTCLLPGYLCPSVVQPFKEAGVNVAYYQVDNRLRVDPDDLCSRIEPDVLAVVIIHYFGFPQPETTFDLIESADPPVYVIEDATHAWLSRSADRGPIGQRGTITVYSPRKFFSVPDGAMAVVGNSNSQLDAEVAPTNWCFASQRTAGLFLRWLFAKTGIEAVNRLAFSLLRRAEHKLDTAVSVSEASWISKRILLNLDFHIAAERRRRNYRLLGEGVQDRRLPMRPLYEKLPIGVTPLGFPIVCEKRNELREFLIERCVYPPIHWLLPWEQGIVRFQHLLDLSQHILTLPVDQRYGPADMTYILDCLDEWASLT